MLPVPSALALRPVGGARRPPHGACVSVHMQKRRPQLPAEEPAEPSLHHARVLAYSRALAVSLSLCLSVSFLSLQCQWALSLQREPAGSRTGYAAEVLRAAHGAARIVLSRQIKQFPRFPAQFQNTARGRGTSARQGQWVRRTKPVDWNQRLWRQQSRSVALQTRQRAQTVSRQCQMRQGPPGMRAHCGGVWCKRLACLGIGTCRSRPPAEQPGPCARGQCGGRVKMITDREGIVTPPFWGDFGSRGPVLWGLGCPTQNPNVPLAVSRPPPTKRRAPPTLHPIQGTPKNLWFAARRVARGVKRVVYLEHDALPVELARSHVSARPHTKRKGGGGGGLVWVCGCVGVCVWGGVSGALRDVHARGRTSLASLEATSTL